MLLEVGAALSTIIGGVLLMKNSSAKKEAEMEQKMVEMQEAHQQELEQKEEEKQQAVEEEQQRQDEVFEKKEQEKADEQMDNDPRSGSLYFGDKTLTEDGKSFAVDYDPFYDYTGNYMQIDEEYLTGTKIAYSNAAYAMRCRFYSPYMLVSELKTTGTTKQGGYICKIIGDMRNGAYSGLMPAVTNTKGTARRALFGCWREYGFMLELFNPYDVSMPLYKMVLSKIKIGGETVNVLGGCVNNGYYHNRGCDTDSKGKNTCGAKHLKKFGNGDCDYTSSAVYQFGSSLGMSFETGDKIGFTDPNGRSGIFYKVRDGKTDFDKLEYEICFGETIQIPAKSSKLFFIQIPLSKVESGMVLLKDFAYAERTCSPAMALCDCKDNRGENREKYLYTTYPAGFNGDRANELYNQVLADKGSGKKRISRGDYGRCETILLSLYDWGDNGVDGYIVNEMKDPGMPNEKTMEFNVTLCSADDTYISAGSLKNTQGGFGGGGSAQFAGTATPRVTSGATSTHSIVISNSAPTVKEQGTDYTQGFVTKDVAALAFNQNWDGGSTVVHNIAHTEDGASLASEILSEIAMYCDDENLDYELYDDHNILSDYRFSQYVSEQ